MDFLVEFLDIGARLIKDPKMIEEKKGQDNVLLNPDIGHLKGISPSFWVKDGNSIAHQDSAKSKEIAFNMSFTRKEVDATVFVPEQISQNMIRLEKLIEDKSEKVDEQFNKIDAQHIEDIKTLHDKMGQQKEIYSAILDEFEEKLNSVTTVYAKKILIAQSLSFICLLAMILLKFL